MAEPGQDKTQPIDNLRAQAEGLLAQAHAQMADIQRVLGTLVDDDGLQTRLTEVATQISGAITALSQALSGPDFGLRRADLLAL